MVKRRSPQAGAERAPAESLWRPQSLTRLWIGLALAIGLPVFVTELLLFGYVDRFPSLVFTASVVVAAVVGRLLAGAVAVVLSILLLDYFIVAPLRSFSAFTNGAYLADFAVFAAVGLVVAVVLARTDRSRAIAMRAEQAAVAAQERLALISEASRVLAASFDLETTIRQVCARVAADGGWDHVLVLQNQPGSGPHYLGGAHANGGTPRPAALAALGAAEAIALAARTRQIQLLESNGWRAAKFGPWRYRSGLVVPLAAGGEPVGALVLLHSSKGNLYSPSDLVFAGELGGRIAVAVDNATLYQRQVHIAHTLQQGLLPRSLPGIDGANIYVRYQAGAGTEVGGDFYDVFGVGNNRWMAVIGDVCGKGPEAATVMSIARATLRALALHEPSPKRLLTKLNEALLALVPDDRFVTVSCAVIEIPPGGGAKITLSRAGHPAPVITRKGAAPRLAGGKSGILLGAFPEVSLSETVIKLEPGDIITFYTDGIEARQSTAQDQALELLAAHGDGPASEIAERFAAAVPTTSAGKADDLVVLSFEFTAVRHPVPTR